MTFQKALAYFVTLGAVAVITGAATAYAAVAWVGHCLSDPEPI